MLRNDIWGYLYLCVMFVIVVGTPALIMLFMYKKVYSHYVNKKLQNKSYNSEEKGKSIPDSNNVVKFIVIIVFFGIMISIKDNLQSLNAKMEEDNHDYISEVDESLKEMKADINSLVELNKAQKRKDSLIESVEVEYGKLDSDKSTAEITFSVLLNKQDKNAKYSLLIGKGTEKVDLKLNKNGYYEGKANLNIFKTYKEIVLSVEDSDGNVKRERIRPKEDWDENLLVLMDCNEDESGEMVDYYSDEYEGPYDKYLAHIYNCLNEDYGSIETQSADLTLNLELNTKKSETMQNDKYIEDARLVVYADDKQVGEKVYDVDKLNKDGKCSIEFKQKIDGYRVEVFSIVKDVYGYTYKSEVLTKKGDDVDINTSGGANYITYYDKNDIEIVIDN